MATCEDILEELKSLGTEQNRIIYKRHGMGDRVFGVSFENLRKLHKRIKVNHDLAVKLWDAEFYEARALAMMIADPNAADAATLDRWAESIGNYGIADSLSGYTIKTPFARQMADKWITSESEWIGTAGWNLVGSLALNDKTLPDDYFANHLETIERHLHGSKNRVRYAMNSALIAIGMRSPTLEEKAIAAAKRIGKVEVDHGETNCKTPEAVSYIKKAKDHKKAKAEKAATKKSTTANPVR